MPELTNLEVLTKGLEQTDHLHPGKAAERLGVSRGTIYAWKKARAEGRLEALADKLHFDTRQVLLGSLGGTPPGDSATYSEGAAFVAGRVSALLEELVPITEKSSTQRPKFTAAERPLEGEDLKHRFLAAIEPYNDLDVERFCGLNHETVRQYKAEWPARPSQASREKMALMIRIQEANLKEDAIVTGKQIPPQAAFLMTIAEGYKEDPAFFKKHPKLGWISVADGVAKVWRDLGLMSIHDEFAWLGYRRAHFYDPETASPVTPEDVGLNMDHLLPDDVEQAISDE